MLRLLTKAAIKFNFKTIGDHDISQWVQSCDEDMLVFASANAPLAIKLQAIKALGLFVRDRTVRFHLIELVVNPVMAIALCASDTLQTRLSMNELDNEEKFKEHHKVLLKRLEQQENLIEYFQSFEQTTQPLRKSRKDMKRLNQVKKALKRPMR